MNDNEHYRPDRAIALCEGWLQGDSGVTYESFAKAQHALADAGAQILPWCRALLKRSDYQARELGAGLIAGLAQRGELGEAVEAVVTELRGALQRVDDDEPKSAQAIDAAYEALLCIGAPDELPAMAGWGRHHRDPIVDRPARERTANETPLGPYFPVTSAMAFIEAPFETLRDAAIARLQMINRVGERDWTITSQYVEGDLDQKMQSLLPLTAPATLNLVTATRSSWCAWVGNQAFGSMDNESSPTSVARELKTRVALLWLMDDYPGVKIGSVQFRFADYSLEGASMRSIAVFKDTRWGFVESGGPPLPFEEAEAYQTRRIRDRLTPDRVARYCQAVGIDLFNPAFYEGPGVLIRTWTPPTTQYVDSFEAGRAKHYIRPAPVGSDPTSDGRSV